MYRNKSNAAYCPVACNAVFPFFAGSNPLWEEDIAGETINITKSVELLEPQWPVFFVFNSIV